MLRVCVRIPPVTGSEQNPFFYRNTSCYPTFRRNNTVTQACRHGMCGVQVTHNRKTTDAGWHICPLPTRSSVMQELEPNLGKTATSLLVSPYLRIRSIWLDMMTGKRFDSSPEINQSLQRDWMNLLRHLIGFVWFSNSLHDAWVMKRLHEWKKSLEHKKKMCQNDLKH